MTGLQFADVDGVRIAFEQSGHGVPLLALHGFPRTHRTWKYIEPLLTDNFHLIMPDRRGYGDSDRLNDPSAYRLQDMTADAIGLMNYLEIQEFVVLGHDKGSPTARKIAFDYPDRILGMIQIDSIPQELAVAQKDSNGRQWYFDFFRQRNVAEKIVTAIPELFFGLFIDRNPHLPDDERQYYVEQFSRKGTPEAVICLKKTLPIGKNFPVAERKLLFPL